MITKLKNSLRSLLEDELNSDSETFTFGTGLTLTLATENIQEVTRVTVNGVSLQSGDYSFSSDDNVITFSSGEVSLNDVVVVYFDYYKYSDSELLRHIKNALGYLNVNQYYPQQYGVGFRVSTDDTEIYPTPTLEECSLIALVASIVVKPNWVSYQTSSVRVVYPRTKDKDTKIREIINVFKRTPGIAGIIDLT